MILDLANAAPSDGNISSDYSTSIFSQKDLHIQQAAAPESQKPKSTLRKDKILTVLSTWRTVTGNQKGAGGTGTGGAEIIHKCYLHKSEIEIAVSQIIYKMVPQLPIS
ncbi:hypothetical protein K435DRAFT_811942 [Dendrothele bispora CBS 962.96]|uniref:Uncharacterized protein n=1 Tax=Dendrothele bispora (strain CBS 962.96) TaxID=1314807 RepID=A0A4S8KRL0_DENBC|nr:hypothetical protein K435DRAFT_811942 [Dendrothele bispora CBS 962.96]